MSDNTELSHVQREAADIMGRELAIAALEDPTKAEKMIALAKTTFVSTIRERRSAALGSVKQALATTLTPALVKQVQGGLFERVGEDTPAAGAPGTGVNSPEDQDDIPF